MQYTSNYNLMLPEGTDTVNLLTQMNPNTSDIDAALFANKQAVVGRATELTAGTVHAITRANTDSPVFAFTATSNWTYGDTMSVDGVACSVYLTDGTQPSTGAYVINSEVLAIIQGSRVTIFANKAMQSVNASDVSYDNTTSGLAATDAQDAIDEIAADVKSMNEYVEYNLPANSGKTWAQIIADIYALTDPTKITERSVFDLNGASLYHITNLSTKQYSSVSTMSNRMYAESFNFTTYTRYWVDITGGTISHGDASASVVNTALNFKLYY